MAITMTKLGTHRSLEETSLIPNKDVRFEVHITIVKFNECTSDALTDYKQRNLP